MSALTVRAYNVGFGDAVLVSVPEREEGVDGETTRHLLIDVGNLLVGEGGANEVFPAVVGDIAERVGGTVDLYVMTHEHLDHVEGLLAAAKAGVELRARHAWLTGSAHPAYYDTHPAAKKRHLEMQLSLEDVARQLAAEPDEWLAAMVRNNSAVLPPGALGLSTADSVDHVRRIADEANTHYVDRTTELAGTHPFREAQLRVLAPEEDTSAYYRRRGGALTARSSDTTAAVAPRPSLAAPPVGVSPGAFFDLLTARRGSGRSRILEIDAANNNTSIVLELEWRGWRLLFPGDAELGSWKRMHADQRLRPVHLVKISHHGSHNGTLDDLVDEFLPPVAPDGRERHALLSSHDGDWDGVPDEETLAVYAARCQVHDTRTVAPGEAVEITFPG